MPDVTRISEHTRALVPPGDDLLQRCFDPVPWTPNLYTRQCSQSVAHVTDTRLFSRF